MKHNNTVFNTRLWSDSVLSLALLLCTGLASCRKELENFPPMRDLEKDAKPFPAELVAQIQQKRQSLKSAEYSVHWVSTSQGQGGTIVNNTAKFKFQGNDQWLVDASDVMSSPAFLVGCDGNREWCYSKYDKTKEPYYNERDLKTIREKNLSFLDPFSCVDVAKDKLAEHFQKRGIKYLGETGFEGKTLHLFGYAESDNRGKSQYEIAIDAKTLLPYYTRVLLISGSM